MKSVLLGAVLAVAALVAPPPASAMSLGSYLLHIPERRDFHTYVWSLIAPCRNPDNTKRTDCIDAEIMPQPIAKN